MIQNPILKGFNPDPSIIRVGEDYYIATSTFEWFPGVQIHHSRDLVHWELVARPLNRLSQLDMRGNPDSCGVWAPCLSYDQGTFYLIYANVRSFDGVWKDSPNYLVTTKDILGDWSEPIFLSASGFDGSLFHDNNGRKWFLSMLSDHRQGLLFGGIYMREYDEEQKQLIGPAYNICKGTELGNTEAPHLYQRNGYYYLLLAEGGTEYGHAMTMLRSRTITGPYELHPQNPILTARNHPEAPLQKCGHGDLVQTQNGDWYTAFLVGRPLTERGRCTLGRETAMEQVEWREDDWLYLKEGVATPRLEVPAPFISPSELSESSFHIETFEQATLSLHFQSLRIPMAESWLSLTARPGYLRLTGKESLSSLHHQSLIARRVQHFHIEASTCIEFEPENFQQMAGLVCYYNTSHWIYLHLFGHEDGQSTLLQIIVCDNFDMQEVLEEPIDVSGQQRVYLKVKFNRGDIQCQYATQQDQWQNIGGTLDGSILSDDYVRDGSSRYRPAFTGSLVGLCCQDLSGQDQFADFAWFEYRECGLT
jgi:xylan 1,4-beta-xylosidase